MFNRLIAQYTLNASLSVCEYRLSTGLKVLLAQNAVPKAMTIAEIQEASEKEKTICKFENVWRKTNGKRKVN
jgi:sulfur transfer complex TusBCD TusB component (DsrH family)